MTKFIESNILRIRNIVLGTLFWGLVYYNDTLLQNEITFLVFSLVILVFGYFHFRIYKRKMRNKSVIKTRSFKWMVFPLLYISAFSVFDLSHISFGYVVGGFLLTVFIALNTLLYRYNYLVISSEGVWDIDSDDKLIDSRQVTQVNINEHEIAIDTTRYKNDLIIKSRNLKHPSWSELIKEFKELRKTWLSHELK